MATPEIIALFQAQFDQASAELAKYEKKPLEQQAGDELINLKAAKNSAQCCLNYPDGIPADKVNETYY
jgi:hypothetical protein